MSIAFDLFDLCVSFESADLPISGPLETFMVGNLQEQLADGPADQTPASPPVMMPIISAPEQSPTTGLVYKSVLNHPVENLPSPPQPEEQYSEDEDYGIYDDMPPLDSNKFSHISLEDLGVDDQAEDSAFHVSHNTMAGIV